MASSSDSSSATTNRLAGESSPYLLQHQHNPVDWYPWGEEAFALARSENRPILLSVGYAACHWCHVMAHESFEDPGVAALMNRLFVNVKVDREERPDVDALYQNALALLGEHGGWPLTMFLTPAGEPFWGGTYFPPTPRFGRPSLSQVLEGMAAAWRDSRDDVTKNVATIRQGLERLASPEAGGPLTPDAPLTVGRRLLRELDPFEGGIGGAPKFPQPAILKLFWLNWLRSGEAPLRHAVDLTLTKMSQGGIYDHLGGGYARYATDEKWLVPHFEKMLYDNAQILDLLTWAWSESGSRLYAARARETVEWLQREMLAEDRPGGPASGGFAASLDADSEGEEGRFYVWTDSEIDALLGREAELFKRHYDVSPRGNWEGRTILNRSDRPELLDEDGERLLAEARAKLLAARAERVRPGWDDKVLADWNGLAIAALAQSAPVFDEPAWLALAARAFDFVASRMAEGDRLHHVWRHGRNRQAGLLDDYAQMANAALALHQTTGEAAYLERARAWVATLDRCFWDGTDGGYFQTADDSNDLMMRPKSALDNATPSGNGTAAAVLARLHHLTGEPAYRERAERLIAAFSGEIQRNPFGYPSLLAANDLLQDAVQVVVAGPADAEATARLVRTALRRPLPYLVFQRVTSADGLPRLHPAAGKGPLGGQPAAYLCRGTTCSLPLTDPDALAEAIAASRA
ncbi:hypothetical protein SAMN06265365_102120 [Tistlia consotensis]|uniref:Spermatogenesis-associated protein 20-like TRX domain-containing protein n=1 Tax=Tistlia consotensis USBA 355 TaxID=560819 RepID=A0A1Y6BHA8_9PROT|nr:thioredoxin domain-containing protein [Tistlia consotensis]SMF09039.1 hypothetical protein SAMN05428998_104196 [Tistlia consotensis USBA 355]SNR34894.1 hypothetical protein SAMN06265365_102120 [Tistlia consotensis]